MKNSKTDMKELPKGIKYATVNSYNPEDIILEKMVASLIYNGYSKTEIYESLFDVNSSSDCTYIAPVILDIIINFTNINLGFFLILEKNDEDYKLLNVL